MIKQTCPQCKTLVEINEKEFTPGENVVRHCPLCDERIVFVIPQKDTSIEEENDALKKELEALKQQINGLKEDLSQAQNSDSVASESDYTWTDTPQRPVVPPQRMNNTYLQNNRENGQRPTAPAPNNHLVPAILVTLFCCWPLGIPAILNASKVDKLWSQGDQFGAEAAAEDAQKYIKYSLIGGIIIGVIYFIFIISDL